jgi:hypothetical protein
VDRLVARCALAISAVVILGVTAAVDARISPVATRSDPYAYARLVLLARASEAASVEVEYHFVRRQSGVASESTVSTAHRAEGSASWSRTGATLRRGDREWSCFDVDDVRQCPETTDTLGLTIGAPGAFVAAAASGRYWFSELPRSDIVGFEARCFAVVLHGTVPLAGVGQRLDVCFATTGTLLSSVMVGPASIDEQVATRVVEIDHDDLARRFDELSDGLVLLDG